LEHVSKSKSPGLSAGVFFSERFFIIKTLLGTTKQGFLMLHRPLKIEASTASNGYWCKKE